MREPDKEEASRQKILEELSEMITRIDTKGILFLMKQANILIYNQNVESLNKKLSGIEAQKKKGVPEDIKQYDEIDEVEIEEKTGGENFTVSVGGIRLFFTREEMRCMVRICHASEDEIDAARRLFAWFSRERSDVLSDCSITGHTHRSLKRIYTKLVRTYKVKE
ncbi:MAG: hypothetical protein JXQ30_03865 [Spirochaetes bacterium]|nr:hypothetical protein [Spirochaetota bacterium]